ncbi:MAG: segregation/condensation protein A [Planctomycetes bacterium]|nr:segregation/condensation protein A [Planctomycetota bacterium]
MAAAPAYRVELELFSGPLDLLLYLVRRREVDVLDVSLARVTAQFLDFIAARELFDLEQAAEFVVGASALVEIKSREVLPQTDETGDNADAPGTEPPTGQIIERLLEYKRYKEAAAALEEHAASWQQRYPRLSDERPRGGKDRSADRIRDVELWDLVSALGRVLRAKTPEAWASIRYDDTPIAVYVEQIGGRVRREGRTAFSSFFERTNDRQRIVGIFLGVLELLRHHGFRAEQPAEYGEIWVLPPAEE